MNHRATMRSLRISSSVKAFDGAVSVWRYCGKPNNMRGRPAPSSFASGR